MDWLLVSLIVLNVALLGLAIYGFTIYSTLVAQFKSARLEIVGLLDREHKREVEHDEPYWPSKQA